MTPSATNLVTLFGHHKSGGARCSVLISTLRRFDSFERSFIFESMTSSNAKSPHLSPDDFIFANEVGGFLDTDNFRKRVLHKLARNLELPKLTFQVIRRTAQTKGTVKDVQGVMRHSRTATTTDVYMQEIPESVRATVSSINTELRNSSKKGRRKSVKAMPDAVLVGGKPLKRGAVSAKVFGNLTPNDTKLGRRSLASR